MEAKSNFECPGCGAKLLVIRVRVLLRPHERATCPNCKAPLSARDGEDMLLYKLVSPPEELSGTGPARMYRRPGGPPRFEV